MAFGIGHREAGLLCIYVGAPGFFGGIGARERWTVDLNSIRCTKRASGAAAGLISSMYSLYQMWMNTHDAVKSPVRVYKSLPIKKYVLCILHSLEANRESGLANSSPVEGDPVGADLNCCMSPVPPVSREEDALGQNPGKFG